MCGIVGYVGSADAVPILLAGLRRLEYRGYDSAGIAVLESSGQIALRKREGKLDRLAEALAEDRRPPHGQLGVGHTRWATHGPPTTINAHPHLDPASQVAVVHNGIIENYATLREALMAKGHAFQSDTDTEVVAHLVGAALAEEAGATAPQLAGVRPVSTVEAPLTPDAPLAPDALLSAVRRALGQLDGAYALAVFSSLCPGALVAARRFSPLVVGRSEGADESFLASDIPALLPHTRRVMALDDGEVALLTAHDIRVIDLNGAAVAPRFFHVTWDAAAAEKGGYPHFVRKEIDDQPEALADTLRGRVSADRILLPELDELDLGAVERVCVVAAGSSYYAGLVAKQLLERWSRLPTEVAVASELRYADPVLGPDTLMILVTQSGETADTLASMRLGKAAGAPTLAVTNVVGSSVTRGADMTLYLHVGPEIGVVATKTFTGQLGLLTLLAADLGRRRGTLAGDGVAEVAEALLQVPQALGQAVQVESQVVPVVQALADRPSVFFIGRGVNYPIALEAALKLKEISYLHAEGYPAGELKHGPIAMLEPGWPVMAFATPGRTRDKLLSNIEEVRARGAVVIAVCVANDDAVGRLADHVIEVPSVPEEVSPIVNVVPAQLFAYHMALALGRDVDQPRNLAKSVTVE